MTNIKLPDPVMTGGEPVMDVLKERCSCKSYTDKAINQQLLSNLLWAAFGINRLDSGKRTAASARNIQEMKVYVVLADASYIYNPAVNSLELVVEGDLRQKSSVQPVFFNAPVHLVFVADFSDQDIPAEKKEKYIRFSHAHSGLIGQNVYLYCASRELGSCYIASFDEEGLRESLKLIDDQLIISVQVVGYPEKQ